MELQTLDWLPSAEALAMRARSAAVVDALLADDPELRQFTFKPEWKDGISLGVRHEGDGWYVHLLRSGSTAAVKVSMAQASVAPDALARFAKNPPVPVPELAMRLLRDGDLRPHELSFLAWCADGTTWQALSFHVEGKLSLDLGRARLGVLEHGAKGYYVYAKAYHEQTIDPASLKAVFGGSAMTLALAQTINPSVDLSAVMAEIKATGHPVE